MCFVCHFVVRSYRIGNAVLSLQISEEALFQARRPMLCVLYVCPCVVRSYRIGNAVLSLQISEGVALSSLC